MPCFPWQLCHCSFAQLRLRFPKQPGSRCVWRSHCPFCISLSSSVHSWRTLSAWLCIMIVLISSGVYSEPSKARLSKQLLRINMYVVKFKKANVFQEEDVVLMKIRCREAHDGTALYMLANSLQQNGFDASAGNFQGVMRHIPFEDSSEF